MRQRLATCLDKHHLKLLQIIRLQPSAHRLRFRLKLQVNFGRIQPTIYSLFSCSGQQSVWSFPTNKLQSTNKWTVCDGCSKLRSPNPTYATCPSATTTSLQSVWKCDSTDFCSCAYFQLWWHLQSNAFL